MLRLACERESTNLGTDVNSTNLFIRDSHVCPHKILEFLNFLWEIWRLKNKKVNIMTKDSQVKNGKLNIFNRT